MGLVILFDMFLNHFWYVPLVSSVGTFNYNLAHFLCDFLSPLVPNDYSCKETFSFIFQIKNANLSWKFLVSYDVTSLFADNPLQETIDVAINLILNHNPHLNITKKDLKNFSFLLNHKLILFLTVNFIIKLMEWPWVLLWLLSLLIFSWAFTSLSG